MNKTIPNLRLLVSTPILLRPIPTQGQGRVGYLFLSCQRQRTYATHHQSTNKKDIHSDLLGRLGQGQGQSNARSNLGQDNVGPFPLGVGASGRSKSWKRWGELGLGGKLVRTTQQTGNLTVILVGGALFVLLTISLTTELFAKNSPSVLYSKAVDMIRSSDALNAHLLPPLKFTHSPHSSAPVRGSPPISHISMKHPTSGRDHLLITFWVHGRGRDEPDPSLSLWGLGWLNVLWQSIEKTGKQGLYAIGLGGKPPAIQEEMDDNGKIHLSVQDKQNGQQVTAVKKEKEEESWVGSLFGSWTSLRTSATNVAGKISNKGLPPPGTYKIGEARAEYVKNASGQYTLLTLVIDVPGSNAPHAGRALVFQSPEAETEGLLGKRFR